MSNCYQSILSLSIYIYLFQIIAPTRKLGLAMISGPNYRNVADSGSQQSSQTVRHYSYYVGREERATKTEPIRRLTLAVFWSAHILKICETHVLTQNQPPSPDTCCIHLSICIVRRDQTFIGMACCGLLSSERVAADSCPIIIIYNIIHKIIILGGKTSLSKTAKIYLHILGHSQPRFRDQNARWTLYLYTVA